MSYSDFVIIFTTLFLGVCALFVPYLAENLKRKMFRPKIRLNFDNIPPYSHKTTHQPKGEEIPAPIYYFRLEIENYGKSTAKQIEVTLENIWIYNSAEKPIKIQNFFPINLRWVMEKEITMININPNRKRFVDIGHIWKKDFEEKYEEKIINISGYHKDETKFFFD